MIKRSLILAAVFGAFGIAVALRPEAKPPNVDEAWLEKTYPTEVDGYRTVPAADGSKMHSYRMDAETYRALKPYGIVARSMTNGLQSYEVVIIAGDHPDTFHNPLACFAAQEWKVLDSRPVVLQTKTRGPVQCSMTRASKGGVSFTALYTFEGPGGTYRVNTDLHGALFRGQLTSGKVQPATFFRFIAKSEGMDEGLRQFATEYLDSSPVRPLSGFTG